MTDDGSHSDRQQALAERRTEEAFRRTLLAEQRTYSAWVRTGLASAATGLAAAKLLHDAQPVIVVRALAVTLILAGAVMFVVAFWAYRGALSKLRELPTGGVSVWVLGAVSTALFLCCILGLVLVTMS